MERIRRQTIILVAALAIVTGDAAVFGAQGVTG